MKRIIIKLFGIILFSILLMGCSKDDENNAPAPSPVQSATYEPTYGGAIITYNIADDKNLLFVKAVYKNSLNEDVFKVSSSYADKIEIDGFSDQQTRKIALYAVGHNGKESEPYYLDVTPDKSYIDIVQESFEISDIPGGVYIQWNNPSKKTVFVYLNYRDGDKQYQRIWGSDKEAETWKLRGLENVEYNFSIVVEDFYGNKTQEINKGSFTPKREEKIDKSTWEFLNANSSFHGDAWEGKTVNFWDDVIDKYGNPSDRSYFIATRDNNGGVLNFDNLYIVIDLHKKAVLNRLVVWQRAFWYNGPEGKPFYYQTENMRSFDIYISNDLITWDFVKHCDIGDPKDEAGNVPAWAIQEAVNGHEFELDNLTQPFRYLKIAIRSNYGSTETIVSSEISLFGFDNQ